MAVLEYQLSLEPRPDEANSARWESAAQNFLEIIKSIFHNLSSEEIEEVNKAVACVSTSSIESLEKTDLVAKLIGREYSEAEAISLELSSLLQYFEKRRYLLQGAFTSSQVAEILTGDPKNRQIAHDRLKKSKSLVGLLDTGVWKFPAWQFDPTGPDGVIDGLPDVIKELSGSDFSKLNWFVTPNPFLGGLTPIEALRKGNKKDVINEARALGVN